MRGVLLLSLAVFGCGEKTEATGGLEGEVVVPPFEVRGDAEGLLLTWFDGEGVHPAQSRSDVPAEHRAQVRVESLDVPPDERLDPEMIYVADLRTEGSNGYPVRVVRRSAFEALIADAHRAANPEPVASGEVVIYGASWCNACRSTAEYLRSKNVAFVEKDIERDPAARAEMQRKAEAAGVNARGIPVIDFRGTILTGFDPGALDRLIARGSPT
jgi:glutaredoxin